MALRDILQNGRIGGIIAVVLLVVAAIFLSRSLQSNPAGSGRWFYDVDAGELYVYRGEQLPPVPAPSGGEGVQALVYACGQCTEDNRSIGYLEKYTPEGKAFNTDTPVDEAALDDPGYLVGRVADDGSVTWAHVDSSQGQRIVEQYRRQCPENPTLCEP